MKKQNLLVLGIIAVLIVLVAVAAVVIPQNRTISENAPSLNVDGTAGEELQEPASTAAPAQTEDTGYELQRADAYLVLTVRGELYEPIALTGEGSFTIKQSEEMTNTVHVTADSMWMEHSTCDNQDCVDQGTVSLENMGSRVLANMIICLPNEVVLELHTPETLASVFGLQQ